MWPGKWYFFEASAPEPGAEAYELRHSPVELREPYRLAAWIRDAATSARDWGTIPRDAWGHLGWIARWVDRLPPRQVVEHVVRVLRASTPILIAIGDQDVVYAPAHL